ncbi:F-box/kelch-repeat protein At3g06240-like [Prosopis cineraria]|uniref:F-box/kelch-repeat protein At3g06240-like n=1 Tax=Prosopis cineraria TaxID=364024 RepID=UPI0024105E6F|nr:F-box/kelch-repeat protein At3g06240-like [Prosopis cineraria]
MLSANLPEEIVEDIAARLPVKSLLRFKSVAKSWYAQITDPYFVTRQFECSDLITKNHRLRLISRLHYLTLKPCISLVSNQESDDIELPFPEKNVEYIFFYGQCNGIFCLYGVYGEDSAGQASLILWNPGTKEVKILPASQNQPKDMVYVIFGFGIDPITKDYKVVRFGNLAFEGREQPPVEVYNLSTDSWRTIDAIVPAFRLCYPKCRAYLNGVYHWLTDDNNDQAILCFDFSKEVFGKIQLPPAKIDESHELTVAVIDERLACVDTFCMTNYKFEIWVMNEYGVDSSWAKKFVVGPCPEFGSFLGFWGDDEILVEDEGQLVSYNLGNKKIQRFEIHGVPKLFRMFEYVESLVSLKN